MLYIFVGLSVEESDPPSEPADDLNPYGEEAASEGGDGPKEAGRRAVDGDLVEAASEGGDASEGG